MKTRFTFFVLILLSAFGVCDMSLRAQGSNACCNILTNGNFEQGNTGFTSGMTQSCGVQPCLSNRYCIGTNFKSKCVGWPNFNDHTSGSGNFMSVDGNTSAGIDVWRNVVNVGQTGQWCFSFWSASVYDVEAFDLDVTVTVNGNTTTVGTVTIGQQALQWQQHSFNLNFSGTGNITIAIRQVTGGEFRDFGLDDIVFGKEIVPDFGFTADAACEKTIKFLNVSTGPLPLNYSWNFGDPNSGANNTSTLQNPTHTFSECGGYEVCLTVTKGNCVEKICKFVSALDDVKPVAKCLGTGVTLDANCKATVTPSLIDGGSTDNCGAVTTSVSPSTLTGCGLFPVTLTVTDGCGNTSTCTANVQTIETVPPGITCPAPISVQGTLGPDGICSGQIKLPFIGVADNCDANVEVSNNGPGLIFPLGMTTVTYTAKDDCMNTATCTWKVTVLPCSKNCPCPNGIQPGPNLVKNGDFFNGNMDFTNDFTYFAPGGMTSFGAYSVLTQPDVPNANSQWSGAGSTTGGSTDQFLVCDGIPLGGGNVAWRQTIPGTITGNFVFCFNANNLVKSSLNYADPRIQGFVNGVAVTPAITLPEAPDQWIAMMGNWAGTLPAVLEIRTLSGAAVGNDFGIDDIVFAACSTMPNFCTANFTFQATNSCGGYSFTNTSTNAGATPTWSWEVDNVPVANTQNINYQFLTPGVHQVCLIVNGRECIVCKKVTVDIAPPKIICPKDTCIFMEYSTLWQEDFSNANAAPDWVAQFADCQGSNSFAKVQNGRFEVVGMEGLPCCPVVGGGKNNEWTTNPINIAGKGAVTISVDYGTAGVLECSSGGPYFSCTGNAVIDNGHDQIVFEYSLNGAAWVQFDYVCGNQNGTASVSGLSGNDVRIRIRPANNSDAETYWFDNVSITAPVQTNTGGTIVHYLPPAISLPTGCNATVACTPPPGSFFNVGITPVVCTATLQPSGMTASCSFNVEVKIDTLPTFTPLSPICVNDPPLLLNTYATPSGGSFTGAGVTCGGGFCTFDPFTAGVGTHVITYTYTNSYNHTFTTFANIQVTPATECDTTDCCRKNEVFIQSVSEDPCCFNISVENYCPKEFAGVCLQGLNGTQFASSMANLTWTKYIFGSSKIIFDAPGASVPANVVSLIGKVCLLNPTGSAQQIEVIFVDQNFKPTDCRRIIEANCPAKKDTSCLLAIEPRVKCNDDGTYTFTFNVLNQTNPPFTVNSIEINSDPNFTVVPSYFTIPGGILPNNVSVPFSVTVSGSGAVAGANFCISLTGHNTDIINDPPTNCCTDTAKVCIKLPECCECKKHLSAHALPKGNGATDCCYQLEINNLYKCQALAYVEVNMITTGVTFGTITPQPGWYYTQNGANTSTSFYPFPPGNVPIGISQLPTFCLDNHLPLQYIALNYHFLVNGQDKVLCSDTLTLTCPPEAACDSIVNPKLVCLPNGDYQYTFQVYNNSGTSINTVTLLPTTSGVLPISPITIPTLANGSISGTITVIIPGGQLAGQATFCVKLKVSLVQNGKELFCCTNPNVVCVPVPECPCKCGKWNVQSFTVDGKFITSNPCGGTFSVTAGQQIVLNQTFNCIGVDCKATYFWERYLNGTKVGPFFFSNSANLNVTFTAPGLYCYRITPYCNGKPCEPCYVCFEVRPKPECECGKWNKLTLNSPVGGVSALTCGQSVTLLCNQPYNITGMFGCLPIGGSICNAQYAYTLTGPGTNINSPLSNTLSVPMNFPVGGNYILTIQPVCGGIKCPPCVIKIFVECPPVCECGGPQNLQFNMGNQVIGVRCIFGELYKLKCPISNLTVSGLFTCKGTNCVPTNTTWALKPPAGPSQVGTFTPNPTFSFSIAAALITVPGTYNLTISGMCGNQLCSCTITFQVPECPAEPCECKNNLVRNPGFWQGAVVGNDMPPGVSNFWVKHLNNSPQVTNSDQHCDPTCIQMWGANTTGEAIRQNGINFQQGRYYKVSFCAKYQPSLNTHTDVQFRFTATNSTNANPWALINCTLIGTSVNITSNGWAIYTLPVWQAPSNLNHLVINALINISGTIAFGRIDNVCIEEVAAPCKADFTFTALGGCGKYQFNNLTAPAVGATYTWDFGDGSPKDNTAAPMHQYATCGTYTVCLTAKCADGSTSTVCKQLGIIDNTPPVAKCRPGEGVTLNANCEYPVTTAFVNDGSTDNCLIKSLSVSPNLLKGCGTTIVTLTVTDWCNNTGTCTMGIQTIEVVPPKIVCPPNTIVRCNDAASINPTITGSATATDNCPGAVSITYSDVSSGNMPCDGTIARTWKATDACGNTSVCTQIITVIDNVAPTLTNCPQNVTVQGTINPQGLCTASVTVISPTAKDNCDQNVTLTNSFNNSGNASGIYPSGTTTIVWTAEDDCKNRATCSFTVTVNCPFCPNNRAQNGDFSQGTPSGNDQSIGLATNWMSIWTGGSTGDFWNTGAQPPPSVLQTPMPALQGNFGGFWCRWLPSNSVYREGIMNKLSGTGIAANSGCYNVSMKVACLSNVSGIPRLSLYGIPTGALSQVTSGGPGAVTPSNLNLFAPMAIPLGTYLVPNTCDKNFTTVNFPQINTAGFPASGIDRIFITRDDGSGGGVYVAVDDICISPAACVMPVCECGKLKWAQFYQEWDFVKPISCNDTLNVPCVKQGKNYFVHGDFTCIPDLCGTNKVDWVLDRPGILPDVNGSTSTAPYPHFDISLPWTHFTQPGLYTLTVTRMCGNKPCSCKFNFIVPACPCACNELKQDVLKGFVITGNKKSCKRTLKPLALCPNDKVTWVVSGPNLNQTFGPTTGNGTIMINFPSPGGLYTVCMLVTRTDPTGIICKYEKCIKIIVKCKMNPIDPDPTSFSCAANLLKNGDFTEGIVGGEMAQGGLAENWDLFPNTGDGFAYIVDSSGALDEGHIILVGGKDNFGGIFQKINASPLASDKHTIIEYQLRNQLGTQSPNGTRLEFRTQREPIIGDPNFTVLHRHTLEKLDTGWQFHSITLNTLLNKEQPYLIICIQNDDGTTRSIIGIDNIEMCLSATVDVQDIGKMLNLRLYPNPNPGLFTLELPMPATTGMRLHITDPTGRLLQDRPTEPGLAQQTIEANELPNGLYFLQVLQDGKVLGVERFVKQE